LASDRGAVSCGRGYSQNADKPALKLTGPPFADYVLDPNSVFMSLELQKS
jgi:hypothetical protein